MKSTIRCFIQSLGIEKPTLLLKLPWDVHFSITKHQPRELILENCRKLIPIWALRIGHCLVNWIVLPYQQQPLISNGYFAIKLMHPPLECSTRMLHRLGQDHSSGRCHSLRHLKIISKKSESHTWQCFFIRDSFEGTTDIGGFDKDAVRTNLHRTLPAGFCPLVAVGVYERQSLIVFDKIVENEKSARGKTTRLHRHSENTKDGLMSCNVFSVSLSLDGTMAEEVPLLLIIFSCFFKHWRGQFCALEGGWGWRWELQTHRQ